MMGFRALLLVSLIFIDAFFLCDGLECACDDRFCEVDHCFTDGVCYASIVRIQDEHEGFRAQKNFRCVDKRDLVPLEHPFVCAYSQHISHKFVSGCCNNGTRCNEKLNLRLNTKIEYDDEEQSLLEKDAKQSDFQYAAVVWICASLTSVLILAIFFGLIIATRHMWRKRSALPSSVSSSSSSSSSLLCFGSKNRQYSEVRSCQTNKTNLTAKINLDNYEDASVGSGSGQPVLVQRTLARHIRLANVIGRGRFGEVWRGEWNGESVAVKVFSTFDEKSWLREVHIFQTLILRHPNIVGFIAADNKDNGMWTQLWLVMEYMVHGSLFDHLQHTMLHLSETTKMCQSVACGLSYLHVEIVGTHGKPAIAHRDLKSKNILVKSSGQCAIGDLGLAVKFDSALEKIDLPDNNKKIGTRRYLAPEVLDESLDLFDIDAHRRADIYSMALVFWEMASRTLLNEEEEKKLSNHALPYADLVGEDPSLEEMCRVVAIEKCRPTLSSQWHEHHVMHKVAVIITQCWDHDPNARLSALRVRKTIDEDILGAFSMDEESS